VPLLDRDGWKPDQYIRDDEVFVAPRLLAPVAHLDAALAAAGPQQRVGVEIPNSFNARDLLPVMGRLDLVAIEFPKFNDGRGFSIGRVLREEGYKGILRAVGAIIPDQFAFALHCGFDEVEIDEAQARRQPIDQWLHALIQFGPGYQSVAGGQVSILERRRARA
jgi:uncharacterized protein (DUF934 family)